MPFNFPVCPFGNTEVHLNNNRVVPQMHKRPDIIIQWNTMMKSEGIDQFVTIVMGYEKRMSNVLKDTDDENRSGPSSSWFGWTF